MSRPRNHPSLIREYKVLFVEDVMRILQIRQSKAYQIMRRINKELEAEGYETISGRVSVARFCEKFYCEKLMKNSAHAERKANTRSAAA
jgi:hypothetical protein